MLDSIKKSLELIHAKESDYTMEIQWDGNLSLGIGKKEDSYIRTLALNKEDAQYQINLFVNQTHPESLEQLLNQTTDEAKKAFEAEIRNCLAKDKSDFDGFNAMYQEVGQVLQVVGKLGQVTGKAILPLIMGRMSGAIVKNQLGDEGIDMVSEFKEIANEQGLRSITWGTICQYANNSSNTLHDVKTDDQINAQRISELVSFYRMISMQALNAEQVAEKHLGILLPFAGLLDADFDPQQIWGTKNDIKQELLKPLLALQKQ